MRRRHMKTRNVVIVVLITNIVSIMITSLIVMAIRTDRQKTHEKEIIPAKQAPPVSETPIASERPTVNKDEILALFDSRTESQRKKVIESFEKVMRDVPPYVGTGTKGYPYALNGQYEKAQQIAEGEIQANPDGVDSYYTLAWIYARVGNYDRAALVCDNALRRGPEFNKMRYILGWVYARQGKYDEALKICDEALRGEPYSATLYYAKGRILDLLERSEEAIESYAHAIDLKKDFYEAYVFRGFLYTKLGRYDDAIKDQKQAIALSRYDPAGYLGLGLVYDQTGNYEGAVAQLDNAITLGSFGANTDSSKQPLTACIGIDDAVIYNRIGILNVRLGSYQDALAAFNRSITARQEFSDAYRGLVLTYLLLGDRQSAIKNYGKLEKLDTEMAKSVAAFVGQDK